MPGRASAASKPLVGVGDARPKNKKTTNEQGHAGTSDCRASPFIALSIGGPDCYCASCRMPGSRGLAVRKEPLRPSAAGLTREGRYYFLGRLLLDLLARI